MWKLPTSQLRLQLYLTYPDTSENCGTSLDIQILLNTWIIDLKAQTEMSDLYEYGFHGFRKSLFQIFKNEIINKRTSNSQAVKIDHQGKSRTL